MIERRKETVAVRLEKTLYDALFAHIPKGRTASSVVRELIVKHLLTLDALTSQQIARLAGIHLTPTPNHAGVLTNTIPSRLTAMEFPVCETCGTADDVFECSVCDAPTCRACQHMVTDPNGYQHCYHEDRTTLSRASSGGWS